MIRIREMTADDVSEVMKIEIDSFKEPWAEVHFYFELYAKASYNWVVVCDHEISAYLCFWKLADELHINNIAVSKDKRRQGIAQKLMDALSRFAKRNKIRMMTLEVNENNMNAILFYKKNGFRQVGVRKKYYQEDNADALILTKSMEIR